MREVKLGLILENAARLAGRPVSVMGSVPENWRALAGMAVEECIRKIAAEKLPMMQRIEYRRYRPTWSAGGSYVEGNEVWWEGAYWRCISAVTSEKPGESCDWMMLRSDKVVAFIGWEQPWENTIIDRGGVDTARFAYAADPKYNPDAKPIQGVRMTEFGIVLPAELGLSGVWVRFVPQGQKVSYLEYEANRAYEAGEAVYVSEEKEVYQCWKDAPAGGGKPGEDAEHWEKVRVPEAFEGWLTRAVAVDFLTEDQGKYQTKAAADKAFEEICERFHEGNGETRVRTGRFCR